MTKQERQKLAREKFYAKYGSQKEYQSQWRKKNPERVRRYWKLAYEQRRPQTLLRQKRYRRCLWESIIQHYGQVCVCCGVTDIEFLTIDHKNNDGALHQAAVGKGHEYWRDIVARGFPDFIQILCWNCNRSKGGFYRKNPLTTPWICPHKRTPN